MPSFQSHPHAVNSAKEGVKSGEATDSMYTGALTNQARLLHFVGGSTANGAEQAHLATAIHVGQHVEVFAQRLAPHAWVDSSVLLQTQSKQSCQGDHYSQRGPTLTSHPAALSTTGQLLHTGNTS